MQNAKLHLSYKSCSSSEDRGTQSSLIMHLTNPTVPYAPPSSKPYNHLSLLTPKNKGTITLAPARPSSSQTSTPLCHTSVYSSLRPRHPTTSADSYTDSHRKPREWYSPQPPPRHPRPSRGHSHGHSILLVREDGVRWSGGRSRIRQSRRRRVLVSGAGDSRGRGLRLLYRRGRSRRTVGC